MGWKDLQQVQFWCCFWQLRKVHHPWLSMQTIRPSLWTLQGLLHRVYIEQFIGVRQVCYWRCERSILCWVERRSLLEMLFRLFFQPTRSLYSIWFFMQISWWRHWSMFKLLLRLCSLYRQSMCKNSRPGKQQPTLRRMGFHWSFVLKMRHWIILQRFG